MTTYLIAALAIIGPAVGFVAGGLFMLFRLNNTIDDLRLMAAVQDRSLRAQGRRLAAYVADEKRRLAPLKAANAKRHAVAVEARRIRMEAAEQRLAMKEAAE